MPNYKLSKLLKLWLRGLRDKRYTVGTCVIFAYIKH